MGMSANTGENPYGQVLGSNDGVPVYRLPQNFRGALQQDATSSRPYGQILGMPTIRPYPFAHPSFSLTQLSSAVPNVPSAAAPALSLTPLSTKKPKVPKRPPSVSTQARQKSGVSQQNRLEQEQIQRDKARAARLREIQTNRGGSI